MFYNKLYYYGWKAKEHSAYVVRIDNNYIEKIDGKGLTEHSALADEFRFKSNLIKWSWILFIFVEIVIFMYFKRRKKRLP